MNRMLVRVGALRHKTFIRLFSGVAPYYLVNEYPKSGGTWLAQMLAAATGLPFRRNQPIRFEPSVSHGHFLNPLGLRNIVVLWRDPRDLIVSFYYHCYFVNEHGNTLLVKLMKERSGFADYSNIRANLPAFIRLLSDWPVSPSFNWPQFARVWIDRPGTIQTSYEALRRDTPTELTHVIHALTGHSLDSARVREVVAEFDFNRVKAKAGRNRPQGTEVSFVREGALGGWKQHFTLDAETALRECGYLSAMQALGYSDGGHPSLTEIR
ncbi:MAG: sulfotransferase domain-containing protein [Pseudomonadota bacterium]